MVHDEVRIILLHCILPTRTRLLVRHHVLRVICHRPPRPALSIAALICLAREDGDRVLLLRYLLDLLFFHVVVGAELGAILIAMLNNLWLILIILDASLRSMSCLLLRVGLLLDIVGLPVALDPVGVILLHIHRRKLLVPLLLSGSRLQLTPPIILTHLLLHFSEAV